LISQHSGPYREIGIGYKCYTTSDLIALIIVAARKTFYISNIKQLDAGIKQKTLQWMLTVLNTQAVFSILVKKWLRNVANYTSHHW